MSAATIPSANAQPIALAGYRVMTAHVRFKPFVRRFAYKLAQIFIDVDAPAQAARDVRLLKINRPGLFSYYDRDHGDRNGAPLRGWVERAFAAAGITLDGGAIRLLTFPRILGFVFNPISVFFGYGPDGRLRGVIYEVNNTFGETHTYVASASGDGVQHHVTPKMLHVSPFMDVRGVYHFKISAPNEKLYLFIENREDGAPKHVASLLGRRQALTDRWLLSVFFGLPLMTLKVVAGIHWEALWIWLRGAGYRDKPAPPVTTFTPAVDVQDPLKLIAPETTPAQTPRDRVKGNALG